MKVQVIYLLLVGAVGCSVVHCLKSNDGNASPPIAAAGENTTAATAGTTDMTTTAAKTTAMPTTAAMKTVAKTTDGHTTAGKTTATAGQTTATTAKTTAGSTNAAKTTVGPTTAAKTTAMPTSAATTTAGSTTTESTTAETTPNTPKTSAATGNTTVNTASTSAGTTIAATTVTGEETDIIPSYQFYNDSDVCMMLFVLNATLKIAYNTTDNRTKEAVIPLSSKVNATDAKMDSIGLCSKSDTIRQFGVEVTYKLNEYNVSNGAALMFFFKQLDETTYSLRHLSAAWGYYEPLFERDAENYGDEGAESIFKVYTGAIGKTYMCMSRTYTAGVLSIILDHVMLQPYASFANDSFGETEDCDRIPSTVHPATSYATEGQATTGQATTYPPTKPSSDNAGMIAGIVIGVLALVVIIIAIAVYLLKRRRVKEVAYGNLDDEHKDYVH